MVMKMNFLNICFAATMLFTVASCGKYGYDFEDGYQVGELQGTDPNDTDLDYVDRTMYERARVYPGLVGEGVPLLKDHTVSMNFKFKFVKSVDLKVGRTPQPIFSTGMYAPAGRNIKVTVPAGVYGLTMQIGVHMDNLTGQDPLRRDPIIYTVKELFPGDNYVRNVYGGIIWIKAEVSIEQPVDLTFTNAVRTSDFILGESDQATWLLDVASNDVPWLELRGKRSIYTVPRSSVLQYQSELKIAETLIAWDKIYEEDFYKWMGLTEGNPDEKNSWPELPERGVLDIQPVVGYAHSGNPWVAQQDKHWFMQFSNIDYLLGDNIDGAWGTYHEIGHNYQQTAAWSWSGLGETTNNLFIFKGANRLGIPGLAAHGAVASDVPEALAFAAINSAKNFEDPSHSPFFKLTPFLQIFNKTIGANGESGWDFMPFVYSRARNSVYAFSLDAAKIDFFYRTLCEFTGRDYARFMDAWGIPVSTAAKRAMRETYPPLETKLWTYNPLTGIGGEDPLDPKYDLIGSDFVWTSNMATATNEGANNNINALSDGNTGTYWHTCYSGCTPTTTATPTNPTYLDFDMQVPQAIRGVYIQNRQGATHRRAARVYTRISEAAPWVDRGELIIASSSSDPTRDARKEMYFPTVEEIRYIRFSFTEDNYVGQAHTALAEAGVFYDPN